MKCTPLVIVAIMGAGLGFYSLKVNDATSREEQGDASADTRDERNGSGNLERLRDRTDADSLSEVIRRALAV